MLIKNKREDEFFSNNWTILKEFNQFFLPFLNIFITWRLKQNSSDALAASRWLKSKKSLFLWCNRDSCIWLSWWKIKQWLVYTRHFFLISLIKKFMRPDLEYSKKINLLSRGRNYWKIHRFIQIWLLLTLIYPQILKKFLELFLARNHILSKPSSNQLKFLKHREQTRWVCLTNSLRKVRNSK